MPTRWLVANTHMLADDNWGCISLGRMLDKLKDDLEQIIAMPELIHDETYMMGMMDEFRHQLPDFDAYVTEQFEQRQTCLFNSSTKVQKLKELCRELFRPSDQDNKESTALLEDLAVVAAEAWIGELMDPTKGTWQFMSNSEGQYSYEHSSDASKEAMLGVVAVNDLAESSFAGVTAQVEVYGRIGMANAAAISDMARNGFLSRPSCNQDLESGEGHGLFHRLCEGLKITAVMAAVDMAPQTRESNNAALELQRKAKRKRDELAKEEGLEKATDEYIECLIFHRMWLSDRCWKTVAEVRSGIKALRYKKDKEEAFDLSTCEFAS